jgi:hypothetical protein
MLLVELIRSHLTLSRAQAILGLMAAILSIGGSLYAYFYASTKPVAPTGGALIAIVQEARSGGPIPEATVEVLTPKDAVVTTLVAQADGRAQRNLPEGTYRLRVSHPRFATESRQVHIINGHTAEIRLKLASRATAARPPAGVAPGSQGGSPAGSSGSSSGATSPVDEAERALKKGVGAVRRIFQ